MFNIGDLVKHSIYKCYGIIIDKNDRSLDGQSLTSFLEETIENKTNGTYIYYVTWVEDEFTPKSWEFSQDLILAAGVNDEQHI